MKSDNVPVAHVFLETVLRRNNNPQKHGSHQAKMIRGRRTCKYVGLFGACDALCS